MVHANLMSAISKLQLKWFQVYCGNGDKTLLSLGEALLKKRLDTHGFEELEGFQLLDLSLKMYIRKIGKRSHIIYYSLFFTTIWKWLKSFVWTALLVYSTLLEYEGKYVSAIDILSNKSGELFSIVNDKLKLKVSTCQGESNFVS